MRRRPTKSSESGQPHTTNEACAESLEPSIALPECVAGGAARPPHGESPALGSSARKRKRSRKRRRFLGNVTGLEHKPLLSGMTLDSIGLNFIAAHELGPVGDQAGTFFGTPAGPSGGFAATPYNNPAGNAAIGYGHLLHDGNVDATDHANYPNPIDLTQADLLLTQDAAKAVSAVNKDIKVFLSQDQFDAMVDCTYN
jgi:GH24 family phage-related lysozyme (muramidase)